LSFPDDFPEKPKDLIEKLVVLDPTMRLGLSGESRNYNDIKQHEFFESIDWNKLYEQTPP
jgi:3-phosphoinositide dependent protein kinase-1